MIRDRVGRKWTLLGSVFIISGVLGYGLALLLPKTYRAEATVILPNAQAALAARGQVLPVSDVARIFRSPELARQAIERLGLGRKYGLTPHSLSEEHLRVQVARDSQSVVVAVGLPEAEAAREATDFIAQEGAKQFTAIAQGVYGAILEGLNESYQQADKSCLAATAKLASLQALKQPESLRIRAVKMREQVSEWDTKLAQTQFEIQSGKRQVEAYTKSVNAGDQAASFGEAMLKNPLRETALGILQTAETAMTQHQAQIGLEQLRMQTETLLVLQSQRQGELGMLRSTLAAQQARLASLRNSLKDLPKTVSLDRLLVDSPELQQALASNLKKQLPELLALKLHETVLNPTYDAVNSGLLLGLAEEEQFKGRIKSLQEEIKADEERLPELQGRLLAGEQKLRLLEMQRDLAGKLVEATAKYKNATLTSLNQKAADRLVEFQAQVGGQLAEAAALEEALTSRRASLRELEGSLAEVEREVRNLESTIDVCAKQLGGISDARVQVRIESQRVAHLAEVIPADLPDRPSWPREGLMALVVAIAATLVAWLGLVRRESGRLKCSGM